MRVVVAKGRCTSNSIRLSDPTRYAGAKAMSSGLERAIATHADCDRAARWQRDDRSRWTISRQHRKPPVRRRRSSSRRSASPRSSATVRLTLCLRSWRHRSAPTPVGPCIGSWVACPSGSWPRHCGSALRRHGSIALPLHAWLPPGANRERFAESHLPPEERKAVQVRSIRSLPFLLVASALTLFLIYALVGPGFGAASPALADFGASGSAVTGDASRKRDWLSSPAASRMG